MREAFTPSATRNSLAAFARFSPSARLYAWVPRSSQWPSMVTLPGADALQLARIRLERALRFGRQAVAVEVEEDVRNRAQVDLIGRGCDVGSSPECPPSSRSRRAGRVRPAGGLVDFLSPPQPAMAVMATNTGDHKACACVSSRVLLVITKGYSASQRSERRHFRQSSQKIA